MRKRLWLLAIPAIGINALADEPGTYYGSIGGGAYRIDSSIFDDTAPAMKFLGGYNFSEYVAVEGGYSRLFETSDSSGDTTVRIDGNLWEVGARFSYPVTRKFGPYGRLGWGYLDGNATLREGDTRIRLNDYEDAFSWAVGATYDLNRRFAVRGEYGAMMIDDGDLDSLTMNLNYRFGSK